MTITRAQVESNLVGRTGKRMELAGFAITTAGANADLNDPISSAMRSMGLEVSYPVTDANLSLVAETDISELFDRAELQLLQNCLNNFVLVDITLGPKVERLDQLSTQTQAVIDRKIKAIENRYGSRMVMGTLYHDFQQKADQ
jgi:hypothetical protein